MYYSLFIVYYISQIDHRLFWLILHPYSSPVYIPHNTALLSTAISINTRQLSSLYQFLVLIIYSCMKVTLIKWCLGVWQTCRHNRCIVCMMTINVETVVNVSHYTIYVFLKEENMVKLCGVMHN